MATVWLCAIGWALGWLAFGHPRLLPPLRDRGETTSATTRPPSTLSIVIPARDEHLSLPLLLGDLARPRPAGAEVLVVDDGSTDDTAEIARSFDFVTLVQPDPPPPGWAGKPWACHRGAMVATGEVLCFLDADVRLAEKALDAVGHELGLHGGLVSVQPWHDTERAYEQTSALFNVISMMGTGIGGRRAPGAAFGPVLMTNRADYELVGGHEAVAGEVVEDVALGHRYRDRDRAVTVLCGGALVRFRMYPGGVRSLVQGWTKNFASGAAATAPLRLAAVVVWVTAMGTTIGLAVDGASGKLGWWPAAAVYGGFVVQLRSMFRTVGRFPLTTALAYPVLVLTFFAIFFRSLWMTLVRRRVTWRGRDVALGAGKP